MDESVRLVPLQMTNVDGREATAEEEGDDEYEDEEYGDDQEYTSD